MTLLWEGRKLPAEDFFAFFAFFASLALCFSASLAFLAFSLSIFTFLAV
jgi:hypothetical protein